MYYYYMYYYLHVLLLTCIIMSFTLHSLFLFFNFKFLFCPLLCMHTFSFPSNADIDFQTFEDMETRPPVSRQTLPPEISGLVDAMVAYKRDFDKVRSSQNHELHQFWLRKTRKPVLSVLMVEIDDDEEDSASSSSSSSTPRYTYFRGINCEVSMPTGSLCSERYV